MKKTSLIAFGIIAGISTMAIAIASTLSGTSARKKDNKSQFVVIIGDSLSAGNGTTGKNLANHYIADGDNVLLDAKGGRSATSFLANENGLERMKKYSDMKPGLVIIFLSTNDIGYGAGSKDFKKLIQIFSYFAELGINVVLIGPPKFSKKAIAYGGMNLGDAVGPYNEALIRTGIKMVNAMELTDDIIEKEHKENDVVIPGRSGDYIHFGKQGAMLFADRLYMSLYQ